MSVLLILLFISCGRSKYPQQNAVWTESIYFRGATPSSHVLLSDEIIEEYANTLKQNHIKYIYIFSGPYDTLGHLPSYAFSGTAVNSVRLFKKYYPELIVLPWIGGIQNKTVYLNDSTWVRNALNDTRRLIVHLRVKGAHIDFEHVLPQYNHIDTGIKVGNNIDFVNYGRNVNSFHKRLRKLIPGSFISSVVVADVPDTTPWKKKTSLAELLELTKYVDQLDFLYYDTGLNNQNQFQENCNTLLGNIKKLKSLSYNRKKEFLIAIGTFNNPTAELQSFRNLEFESVNNTLSTIKRGMLQQHLPENTIDGIGIFCDWQTDKEEWTEFRNHWVNKF